MCICVCVMWAEAYITENVCTHMGGKEACVCACLREREKAMCELCVDMCVYLCMCVPECMLTHICVMSVAITAVHGMPRPTRWLDLVQ